MIIVSPMTQPYQLSCFLCIQCTRVMPKAWGYGTGYGEVMGHFGTRSSVTVTTPLMICRGMQGSGGPQEACCKHPTADGRKHDTGFIQLLGGHLALLAKPARNLVGPDVSILPCYAQMPWRPEPKSSMTLLQKHYAVRCTCMKSKQLISRSLKRPFLPLMLCSVTDIDLSLVVRGCHTFGDCTPSCT